MGTSAGLDWVAQMQYMTSTLCVNEDYSGVTSKNPGMSLSFSYTNAKSLANIKLKNDQDTQKAF